MSSIEPIYPYKNTLYVSSISIVNDGSIHFNTAFTAEMKSLSSVGLTFTTNTYTNGYSSATKFFVPNPS